MHDTHDSAAVPPVCNTGGNANQTPHPCIVDWVNLSIPNVQTEFDVRAILPSLQRVFKRALVLTSRKPLLGFAVGVAVRAVDPGTGELVPVASVFFGGHAQRGRGLLQLTGSQCRLVASWRELYRFARQSGSRLTRIDLAVDDFAGDYSVDRAVEAYRAGMFSRSGRPPSASVAGDWLNTSGRGRTFYVGNAANGKVVRVYEKGRQLGEGAPREWVRHEVQYGNRDRELPLDMLLRPAKYFAGAAPYLGTLLPVNDPALVRTHSRVVVQRHIDALLFHCRRSYGKVVHAALGLGVAATAADLVQLLQVARPIHHLVL